MIEYLLAAAIGVLASLVASGMFVLFFTRVRPQVEISPQIAKTAGEAGQNEYRVKVVNRTKRPIVSVKAELRLMRVRRVPGGIFQRAMTLGLAPDSAMVIDRFDLNDDTAGYAFRFGTKANIDELWDDSGSDHLRFSLHAVDSLSGFGRVFRASYQSKSAAIKEGNFAFGNSMNIY